MFRLAERPALLPGATLTGDTGGPVVDCGELPVGGRVYISRIEAGEIARHFGFAKPEDVDQVRRLVVEREAVIADLQRRLDEIRTMVAAA